MNNHKVCQRCKIDKSLDEYHLDNSSKDKRQTWCKVCILEVMKSKRDADPEANRRRVAEWHKNNPEKVKEKNRRARLRQKLRRMEEKLNKALAELNAPSQSSS